MVDLVGPKTRHVMIQHLPGEPLVTEHRVLKRILADSQLFSRRRLGSRWSGCAPLGFQLLRLPEPAVEAGSRDAKRQENLTRRLVGSQTRIAHTLDDACSVVRVQPSNGV